jgi:FKBP-type peptidyl-prolyl cis-trans isomerase
MTMKKIATLLVAVISLSLSAQEKVKNDKPTVKTVKVKKPKTMKTASGLEYTITEKGNGKMPQVGDKVKVHYTGKLLNDTVFDSSVKRGQPFEFVLGADKVIKGWDEAFQLLNVGDKATLKLPANIAYGERAMGLIPANATLIFDVELIDFTEAIKPWDAKGKDTITTASGLKYILIQENKTGEIGLGKQATVHYSGFFKDGKMFDSSVERGQPFKVKVGKGQVIKGWDEGLALLRKGEKAKLFVPYNLAYGEQGYGPIPAKADLIFDVEIVDVQAPVVPVPYDVSKLEVQKTASGLQFYEVKRSGSNLKAAVAGKMVKVHYTGYLADGKMFDSSIERGEPIEFPLGQGMVIPGWEEGIALMNVGDKLRLVIPYYLAYGEQGREPIIPAKADLTFDVELVDVK